MRRQRMGMMIGIKPEYIAEYKKYHAETWSEILQSLTNAHISNYSIFLKEPENILFGYWEYTGNDFEADMKKVAKLEITQKWWAICMPMQQPLETRKEGEWWAFMEPVFYHP